MMLAEALLPDLEQATEAEAVIADLARDLRLGLVVRELGGVVRCLGGDRCRGHCSKERSEAQRADLHVGFLPFLSNASGRLLASVFGEARLRRERESILNNG